MHNETSPEIREAYISLPSLAHILSFLWRWWRLLVIGTLLSGGIAMAAAVLTQSWTYEATVRLVAMRQRTTATFEPRVRTLSSEVQATGDAVSPAQPRQALAELVVSPEIEQEVVRKLGDQLPPAERALGVLSSMVSGEVDPKSNLIKVIVYHKSPEVAGLVANSWATVYEKRINRLYTGLQSPLAELERGTEEARKAYVKAEGALTAFLASSPLKELSRMVEEKEKLLAAAGKAREDAVKELALAETKSRGGDVVRVLQAEASNRAVALQKEQEAKGKIFSAYVDAAVAGKLAVLNQQVQLRQKELADLYAADHQAGLLLDRSQALRDQLSAGGGKSGALALVLLKAEAFGSSQAAPQSLPQNLQLQIGSDALNLSSGEQLADVQALILALQQWRGRLASAIQAKSNELLEAAGYRDVGSDMLPKAIADQVRRDYLSLFQLGDISNLSRDVDENNQLSIEARKQSSYLMQLPSLQRAIELQSQKTEYDQAKAALEEQLRDMYQKVEVETTRQKNLALERDIAWDSYVALSKKTQELQVELLSPQQQEVQITGEAMVEYKQIGQSPAMVLALAALVGLVICGVVGFVADRIAAALPLVRRDGPAFLGRR